MYKVGNIYHGFKLLEECRVEEANSTARIFEHITSGAHLLHLENKDDNKVFSVSYKTLSHNNCGITHILEHSVLCGSRDYQIKSVFRDISQSSLKTFLNAITFPDNTTYPIASRNMTDFYNLMDVYLNATLYPNIYTNKEILRQEGWRYDFKENGQDLCYKGIVYSEMNGVYSSISGMMCKEIYASLFPDSPYAYDAGGMPEFIPDLTQEEFEAFHKKYYHPVNSYMYLYGDQDLDKCLKHINEKYLVNFPKTEESAEIPVVPAFTEMHVIEKEYALSADDDDNNKTALALNFVHGYNSDPVNELTLKVIYNMLITSPASPIKKALFENNIGDSFITYDDMYMDPLKQGYISLIVNHTNPDKKDLFKDTIMNTLKDMVKNGIDGDLLDSAINSVEFYLREADPSKTANKGMEYMWRALHSSLYDGNPLNHIAFEEPLAKIKEGAKNGYFEKYIEDNMINNPHCALIVLKPKKGLAEIKAKEIEEKLKKYKESLSKEELQELKERNEKLRQEQVRKLTKEEMDTIPKVPLSDISKKHEKTPQTVIEKNHSTVLFHEQPTNGISYLEFIFDYAHLDSQLVPYAGLLRDCLCQVDTAKDNYSSLTTKIFKYTGNISTSTITVADKNNDDIVHPKLVISSKVLNSNINTLFDLINDIIYTSDFTNKERIKSILKEKKALLYSEICGSADLIGFIHSMGNISLRYRYDDMVEYIRYYDFIKSLEENFDDKADEIISSLQKVYKEIIGRNNLILSFTGEKTIFQESEKAIDAFLEKLPLEDKKPNLLKMDKTPVNEGIMIPSNVCYVAKTFNTKALGYNFTGYMRVLKNILQPQYLMSKVRLQGGAYGCALIFRTDGAMGAASYRDPNLKETVEVFNDCYKFLEDINYTNEELDVFKIGALGLLDFPRDASIKGYFEAINYIAGITEEDEQLVRDQLLNATLEDIKQYAEMFKKGMELNNCCVIGNEKKVAENKDLFHTIRSL
ncbi:hypothetical protein SAMN02745248_01654 [Hathewaya proteolytica DSM 3090]|uniref:Peptidase M16C associated domain-containing protein n=1 Tax=Hathewaya proteolytica DSM 3090 TaxID=1121331 RepID=A0A1M6PAD8_9CLOT|nr:insulinase family protein [Hathewaya proteolytica]SHK04888.1 hypothetical protein SAMN02745248_01654 [Hathewaya proteolytica DSM 3090]